MSTCKETYNLSTKEDQENTRGARNVIGEVKSNEAEGGVPARAGNDQEAIGGEPRAQTFFNT